MLHWCCALLFLSVLSKSIAEQPSGSYFSAATLQRGIESYLRAQLGPDDKITILSPLTDIHFEEPMVVAHCRMVGLLVGRTNVELTFVIGTRTLRSIRVPVKISAYRMVPIAKRALERGTILTQEYIAFEWRDASQQLGTVSDSIVGKRLAQSVMPGTVLVNSLLLGSGSVRNGEEVTLLIRSGTIAWLRSTSGHAKTRGSNPDRWYNARHGGFGYKYSTVSRSIDRT